MNTDTCLRRGCMGILLVFGALFLLYIFVTIWYVSDAAISEDNSRPFEIVTKKGPVTLHLGMPKDSVILLVGKPDDIRSHSDIGDDIIEEFGYNVKDKGFNDLTFTFENGKLKEFRQY